MTRYAHNATRDKKTERIRVAECLRGCRFWSAGTDHKQAAHSKCNACAVILLDESHYMQRRNLQMTFINNNKNSSNARTIIHVIMSVELHKTR